MAKTGKNILLHITRYYTEKSIIRSGIKVYLLLWFYKIKIGKEI